MRYTCSSEHVDTTLCKSKLDGFFYNAVYDVLFESHIFHALSSALSDHRVFLLANVDVPQRLQPFKFKNIWASLNAESCQTLFHKIRLTSTSLNPQVLEFSVCLQSEAPFAHGSDDHPGVGLSLPIHCREVPSQEEGG